MFGLDAMLLLYRLAISTITGFVVMVLWFAGMFVASKMDADKSVGGAYFALAFLASPLPFLVGGLIGWWLTRKQT